MANYALVQRNTVQFTNPQTSPQDVVIPTAVKLGSTFISSSIRDSRAGNARGATIRLLDETHVRIEWDGALAGGETLTVSYEVYDFDNIGDDLKELIFRADRALGLLGSNLVKDLPVYNDAGVMTGWRLRVFDTKVNAQAATIDTLGGLQAGELERISVTKDPSIGLNKLKSLVGVRDLVAPTPGVS